MSLPWEDPPCTCGPQCSEPEGCCASCDGGMRYGGEMCWDCRGTGHPHPLEDPACPEHGHGELEAGDDPDAATVWCAQCPGPADIVEAGPQEADGVTNSWRRLSCGHEEAVLTLRFSAVGAYDLEAPF